jgi:hypothetical protein
MELLTLSNTKLLKGTKQGYMSFILHLAPGDLSGHEVCVKRSPGCTTACLNTAGRGQMNSTQRGRVRKTMMYFEQRDQFMALLVNNIQRGCAQADRAGLTACFRLNGTSDIPWERVRVRGQTVFELFPEVQFYDYTKIPGRKVSAYHNYHLTFSRAENNDRDVARAVAAGMNVAVVFRTLPDTYLGLPVVSGDVDDLRFLDPAGRVIGLTAKGRGRRDTSGFVV